MLTFLCHSTFLTQPLSMVLNGRKLSIPFMAPLLLMGIPTSLKEAIRIPQRIPQQPFL